jgi:molybdate transport system ATP-binding protein
MSPSRSIAMQYALERDAFSLQVDAVVPLSGITGVFGESGAGKTTLLRCIAGLERPAAGRLVVGGHTWQDAGEFRAVHRRAIGYVFQEPRLFDHLDVRGNIEFGRRRRDRTTDTGPIVELLGIGHLLARKPAQLSGGEAQRVAIARALCCAPAVVLMDEPLASLDVARREEILPFLDRLHAEASVPVIYVSHNLDEICRLCDHLLVMDSGRIVASGDLQSVLVGSDIASLAGENAGSVIEGIVREFDAEDALLRLGISGGELWVPGAAREPGAKLRLRIRANDVSLCRNRPEHSTILNILPAVVDHVRIDDGPSALVRLAIGSDRIVARVTRRSVRQIGLAIGDQLFAQVKSVAMRSRTQP